MLVLLTMVHKFWVLSFFFYFQVWLDTTSILGCPCGRCVEILSLSHWQPISVVQHRMGARGSMASETAVKILWQRQDPWRQVCHNRYGVFSEQVKCKIFGSLHSTALWGKSKKKINKNSHSEERGEMGSWEEGIYRREFLMSEHLF